MRTAPKRPAPSDDAPSPSGSPERTTPGIASSLTGTVERITEPVVTPKAESAAVASTGTPGSATATLNTAKTELPSAVGAVIEQTGGSIAEPAGAPVVEAAADLAQPVVETGASVVRRLDTVDEPLLGAVAPVTQAVKQ